MSANAPDCFEFSVDIFISSVKILDHSIIGNPISIKILDLQLITIGVLNSTVHGRGTVSLNKGIHLLIRMARHSMPNKLPVIIIVPGSSNNYMGGVNAIDLFQESSQLHDHSSVSKEKTRLKSLDEHEGAIVSYKLRINVTKVPPLRPKNQAKAHNVAVRSTDVLRANQQYREMYSDLHLQVSKLEEKVKKLTPFYYQSSKIETSSVEHSEIRSEMPMRSRPSMERPSASRKISIMDDSDQVNQAESSSIGYRAGSAESSDVIRAETVEDESVVKGGDTSVDDFGSDIAEDEGKTSIVRDEIEISEGNGDIKDDFDDENDSNEKNGSGSEKKAEDQISDDFLQDAQKAAKDTDSAASIDIGSN